MRIILYQSNLIKSKGWGFRSPAVVKETADSAVASLTLILV